jgi:sulfate adenylyltransferase
VSSNNSGVIHELLNYLLETTIHITCRMGVLKDMRIPGSKLLFGLPVVLDTTRTDLVPGSRVALTQKGRVLAVMDIESRWRPDKPFECLASYGFTSLEHPGVRMIAMERGTHYLGGRLYGHSLPTRIYPSTTPTQLRARLPADKARARGSSLKARDPLSISSFRALNQIAAGTHRVAPSRISSPLPKTHRAHTHAAHLRPFRPAAGRQDVVAFQCRNPIHRAHYELFIRSLDAPNVGPGAVVLVHPTCGPTQEDDIDGVTRCAAAAATATATTTATTTIVLFSYLPLLSLPALSLSTNIFFLSLPLSPSLSLPL